MLEPPCFFDDLFFDYVIRLLEIVQRITVTEDDAVLGKILRLKS